MKKVKKYLLLGFFAWMLPVSLGFAEASEGIVLVSNEIREEEDPMEASICQPPEGAFVREKMPEKKETGSFVQPRASQSGNSCGEQASWTLNNGTLTISGTGAMEDYLGSQLPEWNDRKEEITTLVIENGITSIGQLSFYECVNLTDISLPESVTSIGTMAFAECSSLEQIQLPKGVHELSYGVFGECTSLRSLNLENITTVGDYAFQGAEFPEFTVPRAMTSISPLAFFNSKIENYAVEQGNTVYTAKDGILYTDQGKTMFAYPQQKEGTSFVIPSGVTKIGKMAMGYTKNLVDITIPDTVTELGESAFQASQELTSIKIPDSVDTVDDFTFYRCPKLTSVTFGEGLTETSYQMFRECPNLKEIHFGSTLKSLGAHTFAYCTSLTEVSLPGTITEIGAGCFGECYGLKSFSSESLSYIPYSAFWNCKVLTEVFLNEGVTDIYRCAFYGCRSLTDITLPKSTKYVHSIGFPKATNIHCQKPGMQLYGQNGYRCLQEVTISGTRDYEMAYQVLELVNQQRTAQGLNELKMNASLLETAMNRAAETSLCFSHTRPDSSICFDLDAAMYAENIAAGSRTADDVMTSWMDSKGHRKNILSENASTIGIGCYIQNGTYYWTQCFGTGSDTENCDRPENQNITQKIALATEPFEEAVSGIHIAFSLGGNDENYNYEFKVNLSKSTLKEEESTKAQLLVTNAGFKSVSALLDNTGITWKSSDEKVAEISADGEVTGVAKGTASITGSMQYYEAAGEIRVGIGGEEIGGKEIGGEEIGDKENGDKETGDKEIGDKETGGEVTNGEASAPEKETSSIAAPVQEYGAAEEVGDSTDTETKIKLSKGKILTAKRQKGSKLRVTAKKVSGVSGYQFCVARNKKMTKDRKNISVKNPKAVFRKIKKGRTYYVRVRVYKKVSGKKYYGAWSKVKKVK